MAAQSTICNFTVDGFVKQLYIFSHFSKIRSLKKSNTKYKKGLNSRLNSTRNHIQGKKTILSQLTIPQFRFSEQQSALT